MTQLAYASSTDAGGRVNEDSSLVLPIADGHLLAVADGAGGMPGGARASALCLSVLPESLGTPFTHESLIRAVYRIDALLEACPEAGETTLAFCIVAHGAVQGASVGDSGVMLLGADALELTAGQQRKPLIGSGAVHPVPFGPCPFTDTLLLASDGLLKYTSPASLRAHAGTPSLSALATTLIDSVRLRSGDLQDDTTVVLARPGAVTDP